MRDNNLVLTAGGRLSRSYFWISESDLTYVWLKVFRKAEIEFCISLE